MGSLIIREMSQGILSWNAVPLSVTLALKLPFPTLSSHQFKVLQPLWLKMHSLKILLHSCFSLPSQGPSLGEEAQACLRPCPCGVWGITHQCCPLSSLALTERYSSWWSWASTSLSLARAPSPSPDMLLLAILSALALCSDCLQGSPAVFSCCWAPPQFGGCYSSSKNQLYFLYSPWGGLSIPHTVQRSPQGPQFSAPSPASLEAVETSLQYLQESRLGGAGPFYGNISCCHYYSAAAPRCCFKAGS